MSPGPGREVTNRRAGEPRRSASPSRVSVPASSVRPPGWRARRPAAERVGRIDDRAQLSGRYPRPGSAAREARLGGTGAVGPRGARATRHRIAAAGRAMVASAIRSRDCSRTIERCALIVARRRSRQAHGTPSPALLRAMLEAALVESAPHQIVLLAPGRDRRPGPLRALLRTRLRAAARCSPGRSTRGGRSSAPIASMRRAGRRAFSRCWRARKCAALPIASIPAGGSRRTRPGSPQSRSGRTVDEIFAGACLVATRYLDPYRLRLDLLRGGAGSSSPSGERSTPPTGKSPSASACRSGSAGRLPIFSARPPGRPPSGARRRPPSQRLGPGREAPSQSGPRARRRGWPRRPNGGRSR